MSTLLLALATLMVAATAIASPTAPAAADRHGEHIFDDHHHSESSYAELCLSPNRSELVTKSEDCIKSDTVR